MTKEEKVKNCNSNIDTIIKRFNNNDYDIVDVERKVKDLIAQIYNDFESENERLKADSKLTEYKLLAGEACFETLSKVNDAWPDVAERECKQVTAEYLYKDWLKATKRSGSVLLGSSVRDFIQYLDSHFKITTTP